MRTRTVSGFCVVAGVALALALGGGATIASAAPPAPTLSVAQSGSRFVRVAWFAPDVWLGWTSEVQWTVDPSFSSGVTSQSLTGGDFAIYDDWNQTGLTNGTPYYFRVRVDYLGVSGWSNTVAATPFPPLPVTELLQPFAGDERVTLKWISSANAKKYQLQRARNSAFTSGVSTVYTGAALNKTNMDLSAGTTYYFRVRGIDSFGRPGPWSPVRSAKPFS